MTQELDSETEEEIRNVLGISKDFTELDDTQSEEEDLKKQEQKLKIEVLNEFTPKGLEGKSELTTKERKDLARVKILCSPFKNVKYNNEFLEGFVEYYLKYGVSIDRKGRKETADVIKSFFSNPLYGDEEGDDSEKGKGFKERVRRFFMG